MEEFAQTRGAEDLFDDDFTPVDEPARQYPEYQAHKPQRGKGVGHAPQTRGNRAQDSFLRQTRSQTITQSSPPPVTAAALPTAAITTTGGSKDEDPTNSTAYEQAVGNPTTFADTEPDTSNAISQTTNAPSTRSTNAVRGDRTATGGTPKPKLTEEELAARLAAAKLNSAKRAEAHRLAEADEASFQQREAHVSQKRKEEGQARRIMNMEREKNRLRKLGAQSGREWDEGKEEQDARQDKGSRYSRGAHGGVAYGGRGVRDSAFVGNSDRLHGEEEYPNQDDQRGRPGGYRGRGRGERGQFGRGGRRGRGGRGAPSSTTDNNDQTLPPDPVHDFPALPAASKSVETSQPASSNTPLSPVAGSSWADEVQAVKASG